jgi:hypothetical protein
MRSYTLFRGLLVAFCVCAASIGTVYPQEKAVPGAVQVHVVITAEAQREDSELPALRQDDVKVKQCKTFLQVTQLIPATEMPPRFRCCIDHLSPHDFSGTNSNYPRLSPDDAPSLVQLACCSGPNYFGSQSRLRIFTCSSVQRTCSGTPSQDPLHSGARLR